MLRPAHIMNHTMPVNETLKFVSRDLLLTTVQPLTASENSNNTSLHKSMPESPHKQNPGQKGSPQWNEAMN